MSGGRILVVEDEAVVAMAIEERLTHLGYVVSGVVASGEDAIQRVKEDPPDLVLMDVMLRGRMDGIEAAKEIRERFDVPVVYLTAYADESTVPKTKLSEPFGYVIKPFDEIELRTAVEAALYNHELESRLKDREQWLFTTLKSIGDGVLAADERGRVRFMNPVAEAMTGWTQEQAQGRKVAEVFSLLSEETDHPVEDPAAKALREGAVVGLGHHALLVRRDGQTIPIADTAAPIRDDQGRVSGVVLVFQDMSERKRSERKLRESERFLSSVFASIQDGVCVLDKALRIVRTNPAMESWFADRTPLVGRTCYEVFFGRMEPCEDCAGRLALETGEPARTQAQRSGPAGEAVWLELRGYPLREEASGELIGVIEYARDISEQKMAEESLRKTEQQLAQAQRLEAIGRLAGGIAHDFNNLLMSMMGYSDLMLEHLEKGSTLRRYAEGIRRSGDRAAALTHQLLAFSRKQVFHEVLLDLNTLVGEMMKLLRPLIPEDIRIDLSPAAGLWLTKSDPSQIEQVIMNLVVNARDAMPQGGELTIATANVVFGEAEVHGDWEIRPGRYARLTVADTGCGMDDDVKSHIFEPFFTTKSEEEGTGLGLSTAYGIVKQAGGYICAESSVGRGTSFEVYLPAVEGETRAPKPPKAEAEVLGGDETILVVEDDESVRALVREVLRRCGYTVLEAAHGADALRMCEQLRRPIDLLIADVVMPEMGGTELAQRLASRHPGLKVLYISGYAGKAFEHLDASDLNTAFLQKPMSPGELARQVRRLLGSVGA